MTIRPDSRALFLAVNNSLDTDFHKGAAEEQELGNTGMVAQSRRESA